MWIFRNDAMLSVVQDRDNKDRLLVRARKDGDIETVFPNADTFTDAGADYRFRAWIPREEVAKAVYESVMNIDYGNFKDSINKLDKDRKYAYMDVWTAMYKLQEKDRYERVQGFYR